MFSFRDAARAHELGELRRALGADECGIDTHGITLLATYADRQRTNGVTMKATIEMVRETPVSALIDAGGGLGYVPGVRMMARAGMVGFATTNGSGGRAAPTLGKEAKLSTNPLAFAAPTTRNPVFHLDMATTTVAAGKLRVRANEGLPIDPARPVLVAGEDQDTMRVRLAGSGVPVAPGFPKQLKKITDECGAPFLLG